MWSGIVYWSEENIVVIFKLQKKLGNLLWPSTENTINTIRTQQLLPKSEKKIYGEYTILQGLIVYCWLRWLWLIIVTGILKFKEWRKEFGCLILKVINKYLFKSCIYDTVLRLKENFSSHLYLLAQWELCYIHMKSGENAAIKSSKEYIPKWAENHFSKWKSKTDFAVANFIKQEFNIPFLYFQRSHCGLLYTD